MKTPESPQAPPLAGATEPPPPPPPLEEALGHAQWIRELAHRLIRDPATADDVAQDTWTAAVRRPPEADRPLRPWLGRVLRNFAFERARAERHRTEREEHAARAEAQPSAEELVLRAEAQRELVATVLELEEPYRSTVLLRYYEGLEPGAIATTQGVPAGTVRSRLKRALDELRVRLDRKNGGKRESWVVALAPLAHSSGTGIGIDPSTQAGITPAGITTGTQTMITGIKIAAAAAGVLVAGTVAWQVTRETRAQAGDGRTASEVEPADVARAAGTDEAEPRASSLDAAGVVPTRANQDEREALEPAPAAPFAGVLLDERTGDPLPAFALRLEDVRGRSETVRTDGRGAFQTTAELSAGAVRIRLVDDSSTGARIVHVNREGERDAREARGEGADTAERELFADHAGTPEAAPLEIRAPAGPTWFLTFENPLEADLAGGTAVLTQMRWDGPGNVAWTALRGEDPVWARFAAAARDSMRGGGLALEVRDASGLHAGNARVKATSGAHDRRIEIEARGRFSGRVTTTSGDPVAGRGVVLRVLGEERAEVHAKDGKPHAYWATTDATGSFELSWVVPNRYDLFLVIDGEEDFGRSLEIAAGASSRTFVVPPIEERAEIAGRITSVSGTRSDSVRVRLRPAEEVEGRHGQKSQRIRWEETPEGLVGSFVFDGLAAGEYVLSSWVHSYLELAPAELTLTVPSEAAREVALVLRDDVPSRDLTFRVVSPVPGEEFRGFGLYFVLDPEGESQELGAEGREAATIRGVPVEVPFRWNLHAVEYLPVRGDQEAFLGTDEIELRLEPGWGTSIVAHGPDERLLPGTEVFADGRSVGVTGDDGVLIVELEEKPGVLRLVYAPGGEPLHVEETREVRRYAPTIRVVMGEGSGGR